MTFKPDLARGQLRPLGLLSDGNGLPQFFGVVRRQ
jgi:hypothetical protein